MLGVIMLDTQFERPPGDVGNPASWPFPVAIRRVPGAVVSKIVREGDEALIDAFVGAGEALAREGALGLVTTCGFLAAWQGALSARLPIPIATSSLMLLPMIERTLPGGLRAGVITYDASALGARHFAGVGADPGTPVAGVPEGGRFRALIEGGAAYDREGLRAEIVEAARSLLARHERIGAIVLECANLPPFAADVAAATCLPVYDALGLGRWLYSGLAARVAPSPAGGVPNG